MKAYLEIVNFNNDVVTASIPTPPTECCDWGCYTDGRQTSPDNNDE